MIRFFTWINGIVKVTSLVKVTSWVKVSSKQLFTWINGIVKELSDRFQENIIWISLAINLELKKTILTSEQTKYLDYKTPIKWD